jgi:HSP20 family protein
MPSIDVRETQTEFAVEAELPGMDEKDVSVTLNNGILTLKGTRSISPLIAENGSTYRWTGVAPVSFVVIS